MFIKDNKYIQGIVQQNVEQQNLRCYIMMCWFSITVLLFALVAVAKDVEFPKPCCRFLAPEEAN